MSEMPVSRSAVATAQPKTRGAIGPVGWISPRTTSDPFAGIEARLRVRVVESYRSRGGTFAKGIDWRAAGQALFAIENDEEHAIAAKGHGPSSRLMAGVRDLHRRRIAVEGALGDYELGPAWRTTKKAA